MNESQNVTVNVEQIMQDIRREIMEEDKKNLPTFEEVRQSAGISRSLDYLRNNNQVSYYFAFSGNKLKLLFKKIVRKLVKCILFPIICHQNDLNRNYTNAIVALHEENRALKKELDELKKALTATQTK